MQGGQSPPFAALCIIELIYDFISILLIDILYHFRDHPDTIKHRFINVSIITVIIPIVLFFFGTTSDAESVSYVTLFCGKNMFQFFMLYLWTPKVYAINERKRYIYFQQRVVVKISVASHAYINLIILKHYFCRPTPFWSGWEFDSMASYHPLSCLWFSLW